MIVSNNYAYEGCNNIKDYKSVDPLALAYISFDIFENKEQYGTLIYNKNVMGQGYKFLIPKVSNPK